MEHTTELKNKTTKGRKISKPTLAYDINIKIEKGIPLERPKTLIEIFLPYLNQMEVGDSFVFANAQFDAIKRSLQSFKKTTPSTAFVTRKENESSRRIWRTA